MQPQSPQDQQNNPLGQPPVQPQQPLTPTPSYPIQVPSAQPQAPHPPAYDFIVNPNKPTTRQNPLGNTSLPIKIGLVAGGLLVLFIIFTVLKGLLGGGSNLTPYVAIAQEQQELIHLATNAAEEKDLSTNNQNFVATTKLSMTSGQAQILSYLRKNGQKVSVKQLNLKVSASTDSQLEAAAAATTYNQTFEKIMKSKLSAYSTDLQRAYNQSKGTKGKAILSDLFDQADLLQEQLKTQ